MSYQWEEIVVSVTLEDLWTLTEVLSADKRKVHRDRTVGNNNKGAMYSFDCRSGFDQSESRIPIEIAITRFCLFSFTNFNLAFHGFHPKKVENISICFFNWREEENLVVNNNDSRVFMSQNYWSDSCPLEICCS